MIPSAFGRSVFKWLWCSWAHSKDAVAAPVAPSTAECTPDLMAIIRHNESIDDNGDPLDLQPETQWETGYAAGVRSVYQFLKTARIAPSSTAVDSGVQLPSLVGQGAEAASQLDAIAAVLGYPKETWRIASCEFLAHAVRDLQNNYIAKRDAYDGIKGATDALLRRTYDEVADAVNEVAEAAAEAFRLTGFEPGEWDSDNIVKDVSNGIAADIARMGDLIRDLRARIAQSAIERRHPLLLELADKIAAAASAQDSSYWESISGAGIELDDFVVEHAEELTALLRSTFTGNAVK